MALVITADGTKIPVGCGTVPPRTKTVVTAPLADLVALGLSVAYGLVAIDGAKGLSAAVREGSATKPWRCAALCTTGVTPTITCQTRRKTAQRPHLAGLLDKNYPGAAWPRR